MATTSPDNIRTPDPSDPYNLVPDLAQMAGDVQTALIQRANSYKGTSTQRTAFTATAENGALWQDTNSPYRIWRKQGGSGGSWQPLVPDEDTGWVDITSSVSWASGFSGSAQARSRNGVVSLSIRGSGTVPSGITLTQVVSSIPSQFRPTFNIFTIAYLGANRISIGTLNASGTWSTYGINSITGTSASTDITFQR